MEKRLERNIIDAAEISCNDYYLNQIAENRRKAKQRMRAARQKRERQIRFQMVILTFIAAAVIFGMAFAFSGIYSDASSKESSQEYKYYASVTVGVGEDFDAIVDRYYNEKYCSSRTDYAEELCEINNFYSYRSITPSVRPGDHLIISYYSDEFIQ